MPLSSETMQEIRRDRLEGRELIIKNGQITGVVVTLEEWEYFNLVEGKMRKAMEAKR